MQTLIHHPKIKITVEIDALTGATDCQLSQPLPLEAIALVFAKILLSMGEKRPGAAPAGAAPVGQKP